MFERLQRKSCASSICATSISHRPQCSRLFAPPPISPPEQVPSDSHAQPRQAPRFKFSFAELPVFPPERPNHTGLPDNLKAGIEDLSGLSLDDVQVHSPSSQPALAHALAYTQGTDIYVGPGQEQHLAHEAWHVVQQKQKRVPPTLHEAGKTLNDDPGLEREKIIGLSKQWGGELLTKDFIDRLDTLLGTRLWPYSSYDEFEAAAKQAFAAKEQKGIKRWQTGKSAFFNHMYTLRILCKAGWVIFGSRRGVLQFV